MASSTSMYDGPDSHAADVGFKCHMAKSSGRTSYTAFDTQSSKVIHVSWYARHGAQSLQLRDDTLSSYDASPCFVF